MCRVGKTLIDAIKHKFWRLANAVPLIAYQESQFPCSVWTSLKADPFLQTEEAQNVLNQIEEADAIQELAHSIADNEETDKLEMVLAAGQSIEDALTVKSLGFYNGLFDDPDEALYHFSEFNERLHRLTSPEKVHELREPLDELIDTASENFYVKESSSDDEWNDVSSVGKNWSKRNDIYCKQKSKYVATGYRGPFHNTANTASAESSNRLVRYLVEIDRTDGPREVNRWIIRERPAGYHADHVMPLALGGRHTKKNIKFLPDGENIAKKDRLTFDAYLEMTSDIPGLMGMINKGALPIVMAAVEEIGTDETQFNREAVRLTALLRQAMTERREEFAGKNRAQQLLYMRKIRPDLNEEQAIRFIERFLRGLE